MKKGGDFQGYLQMAYTQQVSCHRTQLTLNNNKLFHYLIKINKKRAELQNATRITHMCL